MHIFSKKISMNNELTRKIFLSVVLNKKIHRDFQSLLILLRIGFELTQGFSVIPYSDGVVCLNHNFMLKHF